MNAIDAYFIPSAIVARGEEAVRRARVVVRCVEILITSCLVFCAHGVSQGNYPMLPPLLGSIFAFICILFAMRRYGSVQIAANGIALAFTLCGQFFWWYNIEILKAGRFASLEANAYWVAAVPILAMLLGGRGTGLVWLLFSLVSLLGWGAQALQVGVGIHVQEMVVSAMIFSSLTFFLVRAFESANQRMREGLEQMGSEMRVVLDNMPSAFLLCNVDGHFLATRSRVAEEWLGRPSPGQKVWDFLLEGRRAEELALAWEMLVEDAMPREVVLTQAPQRFERDGRVFDLSLRPLDGPGGRLERVIVVIDDVTELEHRRIAEEARHEQAEVLHRVLNDRAGFLEFFAQASELVTAISLGENVLRNVHTLKGNAGLYGVRSMAQLAHDVEEQIAADGNIEAQARRIEEAWWQFAAQVEALLAPQSGTMQVSLLDYTRVCQALEQNEPTAAVLGQLEAWKYDRMFDRMSRFAEQTVALASRLDKAEPVVVLEVDDLRVDGKRWSHFFSSFAHALRNAIDHGIETSAARVAAGKAERGRLGLGARKVGDQVVLSLSDDGAGVDWDAVARRACAMGLPHSTREDLFAALCSDGMSTRDSATTMSGRGMGMGALLEATRALDGRFSMQSERGQGTTCTWTFPAKQFATLYENHRPLGHL